MSFDDELRKLARDFSRDYMLSRMSEGATDQEIKAELEAFYNKWVLNVA